MKTKLLTATLTSLFLVFVFTFLGFQRLHKPRIFILHSYNAQMPWVARINQGVEKIFKDKAYISVRYFYMDTKRRASNTYLNRVNKAAMAAIYAWKPDVLITFDNDAQNLARDNIASLKDMNIIMAGITDQTKWPTYEKAPNITGITEEIPVNATREILSLIFRQKRRIFYLSDDSKAAKTLEKSMLSQNWGSYELVEHRRVKTFREWKNAVREAQKKADILLVSIYTTIKENNHYMNTKKLVTWMNQNSTIPAVGVYESFIIDGGLIAIAISSLEQGYSAAWLAFNIIEKKLLISEVPLLHGKTFSLFINKNELLKRFPEAQIPIILEAFSKSNIKL